MGIIGFMTIEAKLKITATVADALKAMGDVQAKLKAVAGQLAAADQPNAFSKTKRGLESISEQLQSMRNMVLQVFGVQAMASGAAAVGRMSDAYQGMNARLRIATSGQAEFTASMADAKAIAAQSGGMSADDFAPAGGGGGGGGGTTPLPRPAEQPLNPIDYSQIP